MRFIIMHKTSPHWEAGAIPSAELIARVGDFLGSLAKAGVLVAAEGLRASSEGVRITFADGARTIVDGPFTGGNELPAGFSIVRARSIQDAIEWASREAAARGDVEIDIRPVSEPWDIGMSPRPEHLDTRRYMVLRKATPASETGAPPSEARRAELSRLIEETTRSGVLLATETMRPSRRGRRYRNSRNGISVFDGPFIESKELIAGYVIVSAESLEEVDHTARRYVDVVESDEVDVRELD